MYKSKIKIDRIMYPKTKKIENGTWCIFTGKVVEHLEGDFPILSERYNTISLKGFMPSFSEGNEFTIAYTNPETNKFGTSYTIDTIVKEVDPTDEKQLGEYLNMLCGKKVAKELLKLENPLELLTNRETKKLLQIKGLGKKTIERIYETLDATLDYSFAYSRLLPYGLSKKLIQKICKTFGSAEIAVKSIEENPYLLIKKIRGVSFKKTDEIAIKVGLDLDTIDRVEACIFYILDENGSKGRSYLTTEQLIEEIKKLICYDAESVRKALMRLFTNKDIFVNKTGEMTSLMYYYELENNIAKELIRINSCDSGIRIRKDYEKQIKKIEEEQGWEYTNEQREAIENILNNNIAVVVGGAGTGKTTVTNAACSILKNYTIKQCALSAKAAKRISEVTGKEASTIHRLIGKNFEGSKNTNKIFADMIIVDESSMIGGELFLDLLRCIPTGTKLVLLGDTGQLQAIGSCNILADILASDDKINITRLNKIHRQAQKSAIITSSIKIRNQENIYNNKFRGYDRLGELQDLELFIEDTNENLETLIEEEFFKDLKETNNIMELQVITPVKTRGKINVMNLNNIIQKKYNENIDSDNFYELKSGTKIFINDKIINLKNNYNSVNLEEETTPIFNGNIGTVVDINNDEKYIIIDFLNIGEVKLEGTDRENINLGYAITTHSAQGSQWERIICAYDMSGYILLNNEQLYTSITRGMKHVKLIAEHKAINTCIKNKEQNLKQTFLAKFLHIY